MDPILRWAGSKRKLLNVLEQSVPKRFNTYYEPFAGSAVLFFRLSCKSAVLGDLNPEVALTYQAVREDSDVVAEILYGIPATAPAYYELRALNPEVLTDSQRAARLIFLMKSCFNGVYRTNKQGKFNVPLGSRFYKLPSRQELKEASLLLNRATMLCGDFEKTLSKCREGDFVYLDPPYSDSSRFRGEYSYEGSFSQDDEDRLIDICHHLTRKRVSVLLSFKWKAELLLKLRGWECQQIQARRSVSGFAAARGFSSEILSRNFK